MKSTDIRIQKCLVSGHVYKHTRRGQLNVVCIDIGNIINTMDKFMLIFWGNIIHRNHMLFIFVQVFIKSHSWLCTDVTMLRTCRVYCMWWGIFPVMCCITKYQLNATDMYYRIPKYWSMRNTSWTKIRKCIFRQGLRYRVWEQSAHIFNLSAYSLQSTSI